MSVRTVWAEHGYGFAAGEVAGLVSKDGNVVAHVAVFPNGSILHGSIAIEGITYRVGVAADVDAAKSLVEAFARKVFEVVP